MGADFHADAAERGAFRQYAKALVEDRLRRIAYYLMAAAVVVQTIEVLFGTRGGASPLIDGRGGLLRTCDSISG